MGSEHVGVDDSAISLNESGSGVAGARDLGLSLGLLAKGESVPRHALHCCIKTVLILVTRDANNFELLTIGVDFFVEIFQVGLEGFASGSPIGGVDNKYSLNTVKALGAESLSGSVLKFSS